MRLFCNIAQFEMRISDPRPNYPVSGGTCNDENPNLWPSIGKNMRLILEKENHKNIKEVDWK